MGSICANASNGPQWTCTGGVWYRYEHKNDESVVQYELRQTPNPGIVTESEDTEAQSQNSDDSEPLDDAEAQRLVDDIEWQYHNDAEVQRLINLTRHEQEQRDAENQRRQQELQEVYRISLDLQRETQERAAAEKARLAEEFA